MQQPQTSLAVGRSGDLGGARRRRGPLPRATAVGLALVALAPAWALAADPPTQTPPPAKTKTDLSEVVVNGIPYRETVLPTRLSSNSSYGLNLNVMDTPRNTTLLSTAQLETLNIQDPRAFSYLTSSSYTDSAFGTPNIPRIRGQYADVFYNGMRYSFTDNGYGAPVNFDSIDNISITKGPANVIDGPGPGVGGEVDFLTKRPSLTRFSATADVTLDTLGNHRWLVDLSAPLVDDQLGLRVSYSGENSTNTYFYGHYMHKNAVYVALRWKPTNNYQADFNTEVNVEQYTEEVGINRVNQALIDHGAYLQGAPFGELNSTAFGGSPIPIGSPGNPYSPVAPILTEIDLTSAVRINPRVTIDQTPGVSSRALLYTAQLIQTYDFNGHLSLENNTFFAFQNSDNQEPYYYADESNGSYTIENRLDLKGDFDLPVGSASVRNQFVVGGDLPLRPHQLHQRLQRRDGVGLRSDQPCGALDLQRRLPVGPGRRLPLQDAVRPHPVRHARPRRHQRGQYRRLRRR